MKDITATVSYTLLKPIKSFSCSYLNVTETLAKLYISGIVILLYDKKASCILRLIAVVDLLLFIMYFSNGNPNNICIG